MVNRSMKYTQFFNVFPNNFSLRPWRNSAIPSFTIHSKWLIEVSWRIENPKARNWTTRGSRWGINIFSFQYYFIYENFVKTTITFLFSFFSRAKLLQMPKTPVLIHLINSNTLLVTLSIRKSRLKEELKKPFS